MFRRCAFFVLLALAWGAHAQEPRKPDPIVGDWRGSIGGSLRVVVSIAAASEGGYAGMLDSVDQHVTLPLAKITIRAGAVRFEAPRVGGVYEGKLEGTKLTGTWTQTGAPPQPLDFTKNVVKQGSASATPAPRPLDAPIDVTIPVAPTAFRADGKTHLVYELYVTSYATIDYTLSRVEIFDGERSLGRREGLGLSFGTDRVGGGATGLDRLRLPPGQRSVVYLWVTLDDPVPRSIDHKLTVGPVDGGFDLTVRCARTDVLTHVPTLGPPLRGARWSAANGPANESAHRRATLPVAGRAHIGQRYAIDWVQLGADQKTFSGAANENRSYHAWGKDALAVADGTVVEVKDGLPENEPGKRAGKITLDNIGGNHVKIDLGKGRFAFYAHLQPGSLKVKLGARVKRGQVLGLVGNSGNSSEPHLHFHVSDGISPLGAEGQPYAYESFDVEADGKRTTHKAELPRDGQLVAFPE